MKRVTKIICFLACFSCYRCVHVCKEVKSESMKITVQDINSNKQTDINLSEVTLDHATVSFNNVDVPILCKMLLKKLSHVENLSFENVGLEQIQGGALDALYNLKYFYATSNKIHVIRKGVFDELKELEEITIKKCQVNSIEPKAFDDISNLRVLDLSYNNITKIPFWFTNSPNVQHIFLQHNSIEEIPEWTLTHLKKTLLFKINLQNNQIKTIQPGAFGNIRNASEILLDHNNIKEIPRDFLHNLEEANFIDLKFNEIEILHAEAFQNLYNIQKLQLNDNKIKKIPWHFLEKLNRGASLDVRNNVLFCLPSTLVRKFLMIYATGRPRIC